MRRSSIILALGLVAATGLALAYSSRDTGASTTTASHSNDMQGATEQQEDMQGMQGQQGQQQAPGPVDPNAPLPPNHPSIDPSMMGQMAQGHGNMPGMTGGGAADEAAAIKWTAPKEWSQSPNPNPMRIATYKVKDDTELAVSRAGGDLKMNIARWASQFDGSPTPKETTKTVHGLKVTLVQIEGTYQGGMGPDQGSHANWAMSSAIVDTSTSGEHYFFKMTGPAATVKGAQKSFEAMIDGITSSS